ncbi:DUF3958 family protein [Enterococcus sp. BWM-S5]|uniref:DUF3958 family protein n=1 Tax=Enterococcus larvae TaxID=2794352 RepID=A0ABS4CN95_9ENTE|nr:DUF3958 family protein [Enterococcus larvae]MBP1048045.1 DUF3958 family protein [Enterococcus larvae]
MAGEKNDYVDEMSQINRELQTITDDLDINKKQTEKLSEAEDITQQIYKENSAILDELAYYWKGDKANRFLHSAYEENEYEQKQSMMSIDDAHLYLQQEQKRLMKKEEDLLNKQVKLKQFDK